MLQEPPHRGELPISQLYGPENSVSLQVTARSRLGLKSTRAQSTSVFLCREPIKAGRISVMPAASQIVTPAGGAIIRAPLPSRAAVPPAHFAIDPHTNPTSRGYELPDAMG